MNELEFTIEAEFDGERLDKYISEHSDLSRSYVVSLINENCCLVNEITVKKNYRLKTGDNLKMKIPEIKEPEIIPENIPLDIVYEDDDLLVVNKPKGMVVHPAARHYNGTLVNALIYHCCGTLSGINGMARPGIVHRIDKDTSGLLVVAKSDAAHIGLAHQIKEHSFTRRYEAIVNGGISESASVNAPIGRSLVDRKKMTVRMDGRRAVTHYEVIENYGRYTYLRLTLETGRTHQIRVHMAYIGHPVAGDPVYGNGKPEWLCGQCLHAREIGFVHPITQKYMFFTSELPEYFQKMLRNIRGNQ